MRKSFFEWLYKWAFVKLQKSEVKQLTRNRFKNHIVVLDHEEWALLTEIIGAEQVRNTATCKRFLNTEISQYMMARTLKLQDLGKAMEASINQQL
jgi:hypothetical protein